MSTFLEGLVDAAQFTPQSMRIPNAWCGHLPFAAWLIRELRPRIFVELGTHSGNSYFSFCQSVRESKLQTRCFAVDTWQGDEHAGAYGDEVHAQAAAHNDQYFSGFSTLLRMTFDDGVGLFRDASIDLLHIDGLHTYEAVRHDFETWRPKLAPGALVLLHDINIHESGFGVWRLWAELLAEHPRHLEFLHSCGLGVVQIGSRPADQEFPWLVPGSADQLRVAAYFTALGGRQLERSEIETLQRYLVDRDQAIVEREQGLVELHAAIAERDRGALDLHAAVAERDNRVQELHVALADHAGRIQDLHAELATRDQRIAELNGVLTGLDCAVAERDARIRILEQAVADKDGCIVTLDTAMQEATARAVAAENALAALTALHESLLNSKSWRLTAPMRWLFHRLRQFRDRHALLDDVLYLFRRELERHGLSGLVRRLPYYLRNAGSLLVRLKAFRRPEAEFFVPEPAVITPFQLHPDLDPPTQGFDISVSVVIPTFNAGPEFSLLLRKLRLQQGIGSVEIVVVDSGSRDGTVGLARDAGCRVVEIRSEEFTHSHSRNVGADAATGDYLVFMVQDAYPIGSYWLHGLLRFLLDNAQARVAAASCAECSRSDSDIVYDSMINTHYRFLGCHEEDRVGECRGHDHMSLRSCGQLSDVACIISRELFQRYRYRGDYAEDLDLGIRLIKDGYRVAMLSSIKVIHSHNRPAYYYLKRSFVDVIFLVGMFEDFVFPPGKCPRGLVDAIVSAARHLSAWLAEQPDALGDAPVHEALTACIRVWREQLLTRPAGDGVELGDRQLEDYVTTLSARWPLLTPRSAPDARDELQRFIDAFLARLEHFNVYLRDVYGPQDDWLRSELRRGVVKVFSATAGSALGFLYMERATLDADGRTMAETLYRELKAGI